MSDWLVHHGIEGQQWGVRNGPPYPLTQETKEAAYKQGNVKFFLDNYPELTTEELKRFNQRIVEIENIKKHATVTPQTRRAVISFLNDTDTLLRYTSKWYRIGKLVVEYMTKGTS